MRARRLERSLPSHAAARIDDLSAKYEELSRVHRELTKAAAYWRLSHRADKRALPIADRHYNRQKPGTPQFVPPGRCIVLLTEQADALWVSGWPYAQYTKHAWAGAWICSCFRNEGPVLSSLLVREAVAITLAIWKTPPPEGFITFVDASKTRRKRDPGRCFRRAGFQHVGYTKGGLVALKLSREAIQGGGQILPQERLEAPPSHDHPKQAPRPHPPADRRSWTR